MNNINALMSMLNPSEKKEVPRDNTITINTTSDITRFLGSSYSFDKFMDSYEQVDETLPLTLNIDSDGGAVNTFIQIAYVLSEYPSKIIVNIKRRACSGAALLAILGDEIRMNKFSTMGAFNPYILIPITSRDINRAQRTINHHSESSYTYGVFEVFLDYFDNVERQYKRRVSKLLCKKYSSKEVEEILEFFMYQHDNSFPIYHHMLPDCIQKKITIEGHLKPKVEPKVEEAKNKKKPLVPSREEVKEIIKMNDDTMLLNGKPVSEHKKELLFKLNLLRKRYPNIDIPEYTMKDSYRTLKDAYDKTLKACEEEEKKNSNLLTEGLVRSMF